MKKILGLNYSENQNIMYKICVVNGIIVVRKCCKCKWHNCGNRHKNDPLYFICFANVHPHSIISHKRYWMKHTYFCTFEISNSKRIGKSNWKASDISRWNINPFLFIGRFQHLHLRSQISKMTNCADKCIKENSKVLNMCFVA